MLWKKNKKKKTITDDMTPEEKEQVLEYKKKVLKRWVIVVGFLALAAFGFLAMDLLDRVLKGAPGGGLEINYSKVEEKIAWLGSEIRDLDATISDALHLTSTDGVLVNNVTPGSPAEQAGLARGDVILSVNGTKITDSYQIQDRIRELDPGDTIRLTVDTASGGKRNIYVTLGSKPDDTDTTDVNIKKVAGSSDTTVDPVMSTPWGISVSPLTDDVREQFDIPDTEQGVVIVSVVQKGLADSQGLEVGDVIESINQVPTPNLQSLFLALQENENVLMDVYSPDDAKRFYVTLPDEGSSPPQVVLMSLTEEVAKTNRVIVPADSASLDGQVYYRFASAPYFILYDFNENKMTAIQNPYAAQVRGTGIVVVQMLLQRDIDAAIVGGIGPQSFDTFYLAKVKIYGPVTGSVRTALRDYQLGKLPELKEANLGGYGNSSAATIPTGGSPWTDDTDDEESGGLDGRPQTIPSMGKPLELTAQGDARASRPETCVCPNCGAEVTHPANTACADMVCPICGSQLMTASPGTDAITGTDMTTQLPATQIPTQLRPVALTAGGPVQTASPPSRISAIPVAGDLWAISNQPATIPMQQTAATTTQVSVCVCPLDGTTVTHPIGIPCSALQCPVCGGRMVSDPSAAASAVTKTAGIQTGGKPDDVPPVQQTFFLVPVSSTPAPMGQQQPVTQYQKIALVPTSGGPPAEGAGVGPSDAGPAVDGQSQGGGQSGSGAAQSGRSTLCECPMCHTTVTHPIGVPCSSLTCPVCGSRLVNAEPGGTSGGGAMQTGGKPDDVPPVQQAFYLIPVSSKPDDVPPIQQTFYLVPISSKPDDIPPIGQIQQPIGQTQLVSLVQVSGGPPAEGAGVGPSDAGPAVDGQSQGGGQSGSGAAQSGRSTLCVCPMCGVTVTHPIGVPCSSLTCPVCGSRLVNETPGGVSSDTPGGGVVPTAATMVASTSSVVQVAGTSKKLVVPSTGRSLKSDIAPMLDEARYFLMFGLGNYDVVPNPYYRDKRATGTEIGQFIVSEGGSVVICNNLSASALKTLRDLKVKVYTGFVGTVQQAIDIYSDGRLKDSSSGIVLDEDEEEHGGGGGPPSSKDKKKEKDEKDSAELF
jgi:predicted Fe-Mo cluster-binding NifX family protein